MTCQDMVREFHKAVGSKDAYSPQLRAKQLRLNLIREEYIELVTALANNDIVETADALADLAYVVYGAALTFGIDLDEVLEEVHRTNMAKAGGPRRDDGKIMKPEGWTPPDIASVLEAQGWKRDAH